MSLSRLLDELRRAVLIKLSLDRLMRLATINQDLRNDIFSESFWYHLSISQFEFRRLLKQIASLGWGRLWEFLYHSRYNKMKERVIIREGYDAAMYSDHRELAVMIETSGKMIERHLYYPEILGRLSRAVKVGEMEQIVALIDKSLDNQDRYLAIREIINAVPNLEALRMIDSASSRTRLFEAESYELLVSLLSSENYELLVEYDQEIGIDNSCMVIFGSPNQRVIDYIMMKLGIEKLTPDFVREYGVWWTLDNRKLSFEYLKEYGNDFDILGYNWRSLSEEELLYILPKVEITSIKKIRHRADMWGYDYTVLLIDSHLEGRDR